MTEHLERGNAQGQDTLDGVRSAVDSAPERFTQVQETLEGAKAAVEEVLERVHTALQETLNGVKTTVDRIDPAQLQQHPWTLVYTAVELVDPARIHHTPWMLIGSAIVMGYLLGTLERGSRGSAPASSTSG